MSFVIMEVVPSFRLIAAQSPAQVIGPTLQQAWRNRGTGEITWKTVPTVWLEVQEYFESVRDEAENDHSP